MKRGVYVWAGPEGSSTVQDFPSFSVWIIIWQGGQLKLEKHTTQTSYKQSYK